MRRGETIILLITLLLIVSVLSPTGIGVQLSKLKITFPGDDTGQTVFNLPVIVAGRWQYINITLDEPVDELTVSLYKGTTIPLSSEKDETNYYAWRYETPDNWFPLHNYSVDSYLNESLCSHYGSTYMFCVGVNQEAIPTGEEQVNWTLQITSKGEEVFSQKVVIEKPETGIEPKTGTLVFHVEPFTVTNLSSSFGIHNIGNTPVKVRVTYNKLMDRIKTSNQNINLPLNATSLHEVTIITKKWPPGRVIIEGTSTASSLYWFPYAGITYTPSVQIPIPQIYIYVGHSNYELEEIKNSDITFQYKKNIEMNYGETKNITAYVCGNGNITFSISSINLSIIKTWFDEEIKDPTNFTVSSTNTSEHLLKIQIKAEQFNATGYITYRLIVNGQTKTYTTIVRIKEPVSKKEKQEESNITMFLVLSSVAVVTFYIIYTRIKYRK
ncbi:MAG TPA: hypothetical protein ENI42_07045 [Thermoplasmatales archaeon]|nr:hypothetical protein [Thermoplasmatales archaeon]